MIGIIVRWKFDVIPRAVLEVIKYQFLGCSMLQTERNAGQHEQPGLDALELEDHVFWHLRHSNGRLGDLCNRVSMTKRKSNILFNV